MKSSLKAIAAVVLTAVLVVACGGGGGSTSTGGTYYTHDELAREFVRRVNSDIVGFDLELVKINTLQYNYIVVYDRDYGTYDAYYIGQYNVGENLSNYINNYEHRFYYDLIYEGGNTYWDPITGTRFEKGAVSSKNLSKMKAIQQQLTINRMSEKLQAEYGLSADKSIDAARFAYKMQTSPVGTYNAKDYDAFAKELVGTTISEFQADVKANDMISLSKKIAVAAETTGMGPEAVNKLINSMFAGK